jgi:hypothetical protein
MWIIVVLLLVIILLLGGGAIIAPVLAVGAMVVAFVWLFFFVRDDLSWINGGMIVAAAVVKHEP